MRKVLLIGCAVCAMVTSARADNTMAIFDACRAKGLSVDTCANMADKTKVVMAYHTCLQNLQDLAACDAIYKPILAMHGFK